MRESVKEKYRTNKTGFVLQKGSALPLTIMLMGVFTAATTVMMISSLRTRNNTEQTIKRSASYYAMQAAQNQGRAYLEQFVTERLRQAYDPNTYTGTNNGVHYLDAGNNINNRGITADSFFTPLETSNQTAWHLQEDSALVGTGANNNSAMMTYQFSKDLDFGINPNPSATPSLDLTDVIKGKDKRKSKSILLFFDDKNNNMIKDTGEDGFRLLKSADAANVGEQTYIYSFNITAIGEGMTDRRKSTTRGIVSFGLKRPTFAQYGLYMSQASTAWFGKQDVIDGPAHVNSGDMRFIAEYNNDPTSARFKGRFTGVKTQVDWAARVNNSWKIKHNDNPPVSDQNITGTVPGNKKVIPTFEQGYQRGVQAQDLPPSSTSQEHFAVTGANGDPNTPLTNSEKSSFLNTSNPPPKDVYVPNDGSGNTTGGIYVEGDVDNMTLSVENDNQVYTIRQGNAVSPTTHKKITFDRANNQTIVKDLKTNITTTYNGVGKSIVHVDGKIKSLGGPPRQPITSSDPADAPPAIQKDTAFTLSASGEIVVDRDIKYTEDPRGADGQWGGSDDNIAAKNMLGLYSGTGKLRIAFPSPDDITLHASLMAKQEFQVDSIGSRPNQGNIHILGGTIQKTVSATSHVNGSGAISHGYGTDFSFDRRFQTKAPPYFPTTSQPYEASKSPQVEYIDWHEVKKGLIN